MANRSLMVLLLFCLLVPISGQCLAIDLIEGPGIFKTFNWETGTTYIGGEVGETYFRTPDTVYYTQSGTRLTYDPGNPNHKLFGDFDQIVKDSSTIGDEDTWGVLDVRTFSTASIADNDSLFGDGSDATAIGNGIQAPAGSTYWQQGDNGAFLRGMLWGSQDQVVQVVARDFDTGAPVYRIYGAGGQFDLFQTAFSDIDPGTNPLYNPAARDDIDDFATGWFDRGVDELVLGGSIEYFRFQGQAEPDQISGESAVLLDITRGSWNDLLVDWWQTPAFQQTASSRTGWADVEIWQSWNIGDPGVGAPQNGWILSEDSARFYAIPEPISMMYVVLGIAGLRRRVHRRLGTA